jgi:hypothetical protein
MSCKYKNVKLKVPKGNKKDKVVTLFLMTCVIASFTQSYPIDLSHIPYNFG